MVIESYGFPDPRDASDYGLVAVGGSYHPNMLLAAYTAGIFPWPSEELPLAWFSPNPRMVLQPQDLHVSRSLRKTIRRDRFRITFDTRFEEVIRACAEAYRPDQGGTWISEELIQGFLGLHRMGFAHSVESWDGDRLVGGLYGISLGTAFCGESMFQHQSDASKVAFVDLVTTLQAWNFRLIDCQVYTDHLAQFGAVEWPRDLFLDELQKALRQPTRRGSWSDRSHGLRTSAGRTTTPGDP